MTYVLGSANNASAPLRLQNTCQNDGFSSLAAAYGVTAQQIIDMQKTLGLTTISNKSVQAFVKGRPGWNAEEGLFPFSSSSNPGTTDASGKPEGFAHFTNHTQLMLPDMPRLDGKTPGGGTLTKVFDEVSSAGVSPLLVVGGLAALGFMLFAEHKDRKKAKAAG